MVEINSIPMGLAGAIERRQTTYWSLRFDNGERWRVYFKQKREFGFKEPGTFKSLSVSDTHPLLVNYETPWYHVYLSGPVEEPDTLIDSMHAAALKESEGWLSAKRYFNSLGSIAEVLAGGFGLIYTAPEKMHAVMLSVLNEAGVKTTALSHVLKSEPVLVMEIGGSFVVAEGFECERV